MTKFNHSGEQEAAGEATDRFLTFAEQDRRRGNHLASNL